MTDLSEKRGVEKVQGLGGRSLNLQPLIPNLLLLLLPLLYIATLAQTLVLGDPTEYTLVANILGVAHPPGYAFMVVVGKLFQTIVPFGPIPWRMHLLSAVAGTISAAFVFGTIGWFAREGSRLVDVRWRKVASLFAGLTVGTAVNHWQHAIHANPHIITQTFLAANLYFLTRWAVGQRDGAGDRWLYVFCVSTGLGVVHHPLTVFAFPAYALFIVWKRPFILKQWQTILKMLGFALHGLSLWLYLPLNSPLPSAVGTVDLSSLNSFLDHILGRGISDDLGFYGLADIPNRLLVFWSILRLQYSLPIIFLALLGLMTPLIDQLLLRRSVNRASVNSSTLPFIVLYALAFLGNYAFTMSLQRQDIMAYMLGPLLLVGLLAGIGLWWLLLRLREGIRLEAWLVWVLVGGLFLLGPTLQLARNVQSVSLRSYSEGNDYVTAVFEQFAGQNEGATLLNDWEHMTPLWYTQQVEKRWPDPADIRPEFVSAARPWLPSVFDFLPGGPVYLSNYRREIVDAGFRLRPAGPFYQVVEENHTIPEDLIAVSVSGGEVELVGYSLSAAEVTAGAYVPLTLALRAPVGTADFYVPIVRVGEMAFPFTTDSHVVSPQWAPNEVIVERFDFALPHNLAAGRYPVTVGLKNLSRDEETPLQLDVGELTVAAHPNPLITTHLLANFRQRVGLVSATARANGPRAAAPWSERLVAAPGDNINITLQWQSLDYAEESYTIFVHLIDLANRPLVTLDYTPLGGATPTHLWIPKWLPGQKMFDPYRLQIPPELPPGDYLIEVGLYEMVSKRRLHISDNAGNLVGDRYILGGVLVE